MWEKIIDLKINNNQNNNGDNNKINHFVLKQILEKYIDIENFTFKNLHFK